MEIETVPPGEQASDELSGVEAVQSMEAAFTRVLQSPAKQLPQAYPEFVLTDCQFEFRTRGAVMTLSVRPVLAAIGPDRKVRVRVSRAWLRSMRQRLNGLDL